MELMELEKDFCLQGGTVLEKLAEWAAVNGDRPCLHYGEEDLQLSYCEFDRLTNRLANGFADLGVGKGDQHISSPPQPQCHCRASRKVSGSSG